MYVEDVVDLFSSNSLLSYDDFEEFMMYHLNSVYNNDKERCFQVALKLSESTLKGKFGTQYIWLFQRFIAKKFADIGVKYPIFIF